MDLEQECVTFPLVRSCPAKGVICLLRPFMSESTAEVKSRVVVSGVGVVMDAGPDTEASNLGDSEPSQPRTTSRRTPANMTAITLTPAATDGNRCAGGTNNRSRQRPLVVVETSTPSRTLRAAFNSGYTRRAKSANPVEEEEAAEK